MILLSDLLIYAYGASLADYYVKKCSQRKQRRFLFSQLLYLTPVSLTSVLIFYINSLGILESIVLSIYIYYYVKNSIQIKYFFNKLDFGINYYYVVLRLIPYFIFLCLVYTLSLDSVIWFVVLLLCLEIYTYHWLKNLIHKSDFVVRLKFRALDIGDVCKFFILYLLMGLVIRGDLFVAEYFFPNDFVEYYQFIMTMMVAVNPIALLTTSSLLSILTKFELEDIRQHKVFLSICILILSIVMGGIAYFFIDMLVGIMYPNNTLLKANRELVMYVVPLTITFIIVKTVLIKLLSTTSMLYLNIVVLVGLLIPQDTVVEMLISYYVIRAFFHVVFFLRA